MAYNGQNLDFVGVFRSNYSIEEIFEKYYSILNPNGMIMVLLKNYSKRSLNTIIQTLKSKNINYEVSYISSKFLFISKKIEI
ncbi:BC85_0335 family putative methyltransferase [Mycoplasmopsis cynos]|uniref:BC85_0335 family putative methyltransferase n=1 Tax=Mycoplasmopsis cynos TaxID=171284 RepID=UPI003A5C8187